MAESNYTKIIANLQLAETKIVEAMAAGGSAVKSLEIRGRIVEFKDLAKELKEIRKLISTYESLDAGRSLNRPARSRVRLKYN